MSAHNISIITYTIHFAVEYPMTMIMNQILFYKKNTFKMNELFNRSRKNIINYKLELLLAITKYSEN